MLRRDIVGRLGRDIVGTLGRYIYTNSENVRKIYIVRPLRSDIVRALRRDLKWAR